MQSFPDNHNFTTAKFKRTIGENTPCNASTAVAMFGPQPTQYKWALWVVLVLMLLAVLALVQRNVDIQKQQHVPAIFDSGITCSQTPIQLAGK